ncbi:MAG: type IX secretion system outer membrane channel protein PorV [Sphingomonadales bacterium]|nr:type IX secretion system outer membrane channel protein PorV [Sphingomonadales bacterium]
MILRPKFRILAFKSATFIGLILSSAWGANGQTTTPGPLGGGNLNTITTAVPFLMISPDARSGAMGDVGVAISPDANSMFWNAAKLSFVENNSGIAMNYTPWLRNLVPDVSLAYVSGYFRLDNLQAVGVSMRYFSLGDINFTDINGASLGTFNPNEFAVDGSYSRKLSDEFSVGVGLRYVYSNLAAGFDPNNQFKAGTAVAGDLSFYYNRSRRMFGKDGNIAAGLVISNMGNKMAYSESGQTSFIPANLRLGTTITTVIDRYNKVSFSLDLNKLLVPTNPVYKRDSLNRIVILAGVPVIERGDDPNQKSVIEGMLGSFNDAPDGFKEELREINPSIGVEYLYNQVFALRGGYMYEHPTKGGRQYFTAGMGLQYNVFNLNFSYLLPIGQLQTNPLANTLRFSLMFDLGALGKPNAAEGSMPVIE